MDVANEPAVEPRLREILGGVAAFRVLALVWVFAVTVVDARSGVLDKPLVAFVVVAVLTAWTAFLGLAAQSRPHLLTVPAVIVVDIALAGVTIGMDWVVYSGDHPQSFGSAWPVAAVLSTAAILGWRAGLTSGVGLGGVNIVSAAMADRLGGRVLALTGSLVLMAVAGVVAAYITSRLRWADSTIEEARARERFATTLHDGVLQTLAVVQRRSDDPMLVEMARTQEWELRDFIGHGSSATGYEDDVLSGLRHVAARAEAFHDIRVRLVVVEAPSLSPAQATAVVGAVAEALVNAAKHSGASTVTVCVDRADGASLVTVNDDGCGFDVESTPEGTGLRHSVRGRLAEVGGTVEVRSRPGRGNGGSAVGSLSEPIRIVIADDHEIWRSGLRADLGERFVVVGEADDAPGAIEALRRESPDLALVDLHMGGGGGIAVASACAVEVPIVILTVSEAERDLLDAVAAGAVGFLTKSTRPDDLRAALVAAAGGEPVFSPHLAALLLGEFRRLAGRDDGTQVLSPREREVVGLVARGHSYRAVADELFISPKTVENHVRNIMAKLHLSRRHELIRWAVDRGIT